MTFLRVATLHALLHSLLHEPNALAMCCCDTLCAATAIIVHARITTVHARITMRCERQHCTLERSDSDSIALRRSELFLRHTSL